MGKYFKSYVQAGNLHIVDLFDSYVQVNAVFVEYEKKQEKSFGTRLTNHTFTPILGREDMATS